MNKNEIALNKINKSIKILIYLFIAFMVIPAICGLLAFISLMLTKG